MQEEHAWLGGGGVHKVWSRSSHGLEEGHMRLGGGAHTAWRSSQGLEEERTCPGGSLEPPWSSSECTYTDVMHEEPADQDFMKIIFSVKCTIGSIKGECKQRML